MGTAERSLGREELPFLAVSAAAIVIVAQLSDPGTGFELFLLICAAVAFTGQVLLPSAPVEVIAVMVVVPVSIAVGHHGSLEVGFFLVVLTTLYASWHLDSTLRAAIVALVSAAAILFVARVRHGDLSWQPWISAEVFTFAMGRVLFRQRTLIAELHTARQALADQAVAEERRRIARELHDLAGHTLAAMLLHVTGARHVLHRDVDEAERALLDAEGVGRASMDQIRATVTALRTTEQGTDAALPDGGDVVVLIDEYRRAGLAVDADIDEQIARIGGPCGLALHRILREALANAARHAPRNHVRVHAGLAPGASTVHLTVSDHGRPPGDHGPPVGRFGLVGMRERARSLGGSVEAGPTPDGWRVHALLPMSATEHDPKARW